MFTEVLKLSVFFESLKIIDFGLQQGEVKNILIQMDLMPPFHLILKLNGYRKED